MFVTFHPGVTLVSALADPTALWGVFQYHPHCGHCCPSHARAATVYHATHAASGDSLFYTSDYIILIIIQIGWHVGGWQQCSTGSSSGCYPMMSSIGKSRPCLVKNGHKCHPVFFQRDSSLNSWQRMWFSGSALMIDLKLVDCAWNAIPVSPAATCWLRQV